MYGGLHRNLRLWSVIPTVVARNWQDGTRRSRKLSGYTHLRIFSVAGVSMVGYHVHRSDDYVDYRKSRLKGIEKKKSDLLKRLKKLSS